MRETNGTQGGLCALQGELAMPAEVQDLILKRIDELKQESNEQHQLILTRLDKVDDDFRKFENRVTKLETEAKNSRWIYAIVGGGVILAVKEGVVWFINDILPQATEAAVDVIFYLIA